jgi:Bacterial extracellular solute-binding protein, family 7
MLMPSAQLPLAITRHIVDGCVLPWNMVPALKLYDLLKAHTDFADVSLSTTTYVLAMNKAAYEGLPSDLKKVMDDNSGQVAAGMAGTMWDLQASSVVDMVSHRGDPIVTLTPDAVAPWRKATQPVIDAWLRQMKARKVDGEKLLAEAHSLFDKYASEPEPQPPRPPQPPAQAKAEPNPPPKAAGPAGTPEAPAPATQVSVVTPAPNPGPTHHWWQFWKSASAPASPAGSAAPAPTTHWWQFWKSASAPAPTPAPAAATPPAAAPGLVPPVTPAAPAASVAPPAPVAASPAPVPPAPPAAAVIVQPPPVAPVAPAAPPTTLDIPL